MAGSSHHIHQSSIRTSGQAMTDVFLLMSSVVFRWKKSVCCLECFLPRLLFLLWKCDFFPPPAACKNTSSLHGLRIGGAPLLVTKEMYFYVKTVPNAGCLLHIPSLLSGIFALRAGETFVTLSFSDCHQSPHTALADLACSAACPFDTPVPCHDDSSAFCPLWAL